MENSRPVRVTSTSGYEKVFPSIKDANKSLFRGNILVYNSIIRVLKNNKNTPIKHEEHGNLYFWYKN